MKFRDIVYEELEFRGMYIKKLAAKIGEKPYSLSYCLKENGTNPKTDLVWKISKEFCLPMEYLVIGEFSKQTQNSINELPYSYQKILLTMSKIPKATQNNFNQLAEI